MTRGSRVRSGCPSAGQSISPAPARPRRSDPIRSARNNKDTRIRKNDSETEKFPDFLMLRHCYSTGEVSLSFAIERPCARNPNAGTSRLFSYVVPLLQNNKRIRRATAHILTIILENDVGTLSAPPEEHTLPCRNTRHFAFLRDKRAA